MRIWAFPEFPDSRDHPQGPKTWTCLLPKSRNVALVTQSLLSEQEKPWNACLGCFSFVERRFHSYSKRCTARTSLRKPCKTKHRQLWSHPTQMGHVRLVPTRMAKESAQPGAAICFWYSITLMIKALDLMSLWKRERVRASPTNSRPIWNAAFGQEKYIHPEITL